MLLTSLSDLLGGQLKSKLLLSFCLLNTGCVAILGGTYQTADVVTTGATAASYGTTGKGLTDHAISYVVGKDCRMFNVFKNKNVCRIRKTYEVRHLQEGNRQELQVETLPNINSLKQKEKINVTKLGTRHPRHAHKVWRKGSHKKIKR
jgi:hypothetical protein